MEVTNITENEQYQFIQVYDQGGRFRETVESLWGDGRSGPGLSFILKEEGEVLGRVGYWTPQNEQENLCLYGLALPWEDENILDIGRTLLSKSMEKLKNQGAKTLTAQLHSSDGRAFSLSKQIFSSLGINQIQAKESFSLTKKDYNTDWENRLDYKSLNEAGEDKFINIIKEVTQNTLDEEDRLNIAEVGEKQAALDHFKMLQSIDSSEENWLLGYLNQKIIGLIIPQHLNNQIGAINYIGVIPEERGNKYGVDLLHRGIKNLFGRDIEKIIADIDKANFPMRNALLESGFKVDKEVLIYRTKL